MYSYWNHLNRLSLHPHPHQHRSVTGTHHKLRAGTGTTMHGIATVPKAGTRSHLMPPTIPTTTMRVASTTRGSEGEGCNSRPARRGGMMTGTMKMRTTPPTVPPTPARTSCLGQETLDYLPQSEKKTDDSKFRFFQIRHSEEKFQQILYFCQNWRGCLFDGNSVSKCVRE